MDKLSFYQIQALFNTQIRNVGLYLSLSLGLLGYSRYYRKEDSNVGYLYDLSFLLLSIFFLSISLYICYNMIINHNIYIKNIKNEELELLNRWIILPKLLFVLLITIIIFNLYTFFRQINS